MQGVLFLVWFNNFDRTVGLELHALTRAARSYALLTYLLQVHLFLPTSLCVPGDAEVISIDAFVKEPNGLIFGVTLIKVS